MKRLKNYIPLLLIFLFSSTAFAHFGSKGPYGGTATCSIVFDTTVYIGTADGGVFESTSTKLVGWRPRPVGLKSGKITALTHSGKYLFAGTADSGVYIFKGFIGSDRYWQKINNGLGNLKIMSLLAVDTVTILAGTNGGGVYKTVDKGATWTHISSAILDADAITGIIQAGNKAVLISLSHGVFISDNKGDSWTDFNDTNTLNIPGATSLSFNATTNELMVLNGNGLLRSAFVPANPVATYSKIATPINAPIRNISNNGTAWFLASYTEGAFISPSNAINWTAINTGLPSKTLYTLLPFQTSLIAGVAGEGIYKASIASSTWVANNFGFNNTRTFSMACSGEAVVVAATDKGIFVSKDLANSYKRSNKGLTDSLHVTNLVFWGSKLLAATENGGVFISTDTGANWTPFNNGMINLKITRILASASYAYAFNTLGGVYQTDGATWKEIYSSPQNLMADLAFFGGKVALAIRNVGVKVAYEKNPAFANFGPSNLDVTSLTVQGGKLFAGTNGSGVYITDTAAASWTPTALTSISHTTLIGLNGNNIEAMATYNGYVFASYKGGLLATSDYGKTWIAGGNQFNLPSYTHVYKIDFVTTRVFVTTEYNGLYSNALSELPPLGIDELENHIGNFNIYPNPSNGIVNIDLKNIKGTVKQVIVYDQEGKKVTFVQPVSSLSLNTQLHIAPGVYYIQVVTNKGTAAQKIVIQ